jgi:hypothetical protein
MTNRANCDRKKNSSVWLSPLNPKMLSENYSKHLTTCLNKSEYLMLIIVVQLLQLSKKVRLEELATRLPIPIIFQSRRKKLKRFLESRYLTIEGVWIPIVSQWIEKEFIPQQIIHIAIDRTQWGWINILMVSLIVNNRGIPLYFELLDHKGNSDLENQQEILSRVLPMLKNYKTVLLGDREFCSVELARWLNGQKKVYFCLRLKKSTYIEVEKETWIALKNIGLEPGTSLYYQGVKVTKTKGFVGGNVAGKWKGKYRGMTAEEGWFILTNLTSLKEAITSYQKRMGIEEMFRDFKKGGYDLERTKLTGHRLNSIILLITLAYSQTTIAGKVIKDKGVAKYVGRVKEKNRYSRRHSDFYLGLNGKDWLLSWQLLSVEAQALMQLSPQKRTHYQQGLRAISHIQSSF